MKETLWDATLGGIVIGGTAWAIAKNTLKNAIKKVGIAVWVSTSILSAIDHYRDTQAEIDKVTEKRDKINKESKALWNQYLECLNHSHASGSLSPYMNSQTYVKYGETHYALYQSNLPYDSVWWYVRSPSESGYGTNVSTEYGDGSKLSSTFSWTAPETTGTYTITAYVYYTNTIIEQSYDITVH